MPLFTRPDFDWERPLCVFCSRSPARQRGAADVQNVDEYPEHAVREVLLRLVGKRHVGELVPFELLVALILSENRSKFPDGRFRPYREDRQKRSRGRKAEPPPISGSSMDVKNHRGLARLRLNLALSSGRPVIAELFA